MVDVVWRLFVLLVGMVVLVIALSSSVTFIAAVAGVVFWVVYADDISQAVSDIWHRDFWVWEP